MSGEADRETLAGWVSGPGLDTLARAPDRIAERYEILGLLGSGGMGAVYRVRDRELDEVIALKLLKPELVASPGMLARFRQEVKLARRVTHPNVVRTFDLGEHGTARFLTMELIEGQSLTRLLEEQGALPLSDAHAICRAIAAGMAAAHRASVLHLDLKPDNVIVGPAPLDTARVAVTDFGISRAAGSSREGGGLVGTPAYMAPEQVRGDATVDARTDVYALGALFYEVVTGRRAWPGDNPYAVALARLQQDPPDPRRAAPVPDRLAELILACLSREASDRPASAEDVERALATIDAPQRRRSRAAAVPSPAGNGVAVLPFSVSDPNDKWLGTAVAEEVIDALSLSPGLRVRPFSAVAGLPPSDPVEQGRALGVTVVVDGSVRRNGGRLRLTVRALGVADGFQLWATRVDAEEGDLLSRADEVAQGIARSITVKIDPPSRRPPPDPRAVELYLRGRAAMRDGWAGNLEPAVSLFEQALTLAPDDPSALAGLASARARQAMVRGNSLGPGDPDLEILARKAAERAVTVAPDRGETWLALATERLYAMDTPACARALRMAVDRAPGLGRAYAMIGYLLLEAGRLDAAERRLRAALAEDPASTARTDLSRLFAYRGDWERVTRAIEDMSGLGPTAMWSGQLHAARFRLWGAPARATPYVFDSVPPIMTDLVTFLDVLNTSLPGAGVSPGEAAIALAAIEAPSPRMALVRAQHCAELIAYRGDPDLAMRVIDRAVERGLEDVHWLRACPVLEPLRQRPDFAAALDEVGRRSAVIMDALGDVAW